MFEEEQLNLRKLNADVAAKNKPQQFPTSPSEGKKTAAVTWK